MFHEVPSPGIVCWITLPDNRLGWKVSQCKSIGGKIISFLIVVSTGSLSLLKLNFELERGSLAEWAVRGEVLSG